MKGAVRTRVPRCGRDGRGALASRIADTGGLPRVQCGNATLSVEARRAVPSMTSCAVLTGLFEALDSAKPAGDPGSENISGAVMALLGKQPAVVADTITLNSMQPCLLNVVFNTCQLPMTSRDEQPSPTVVACMLTGVSVDRYNVTHTWVE